MSARLSGVKRCADERDDDSGLDAAPTPQAEPKAAREPGADAGADADSSVERAEHVGAVGGGGASGNADAPTAALAPDSAPAAAPVAERAGASRALRCVSRYGRYVPYFVTFLLFFARRFGPQLRNRSPFRSARSLSPPGPSPTPPSWT
jgi:hypothetical protein